VDHQYVFTADPSPFGYDGERYVFYGHHPILTSDRTIVYCFVDDAHYHPFAAANDADFVSKGGVAFYVGLFPPYFFHLKATIGRLVNDFYRPHAHLRPAIDVDPPAEWRGDLHLPAPVRTQSTAPSARKVLVRSNRDASRH
jgi:hypothetical protein